MKEDLQIEIASNTDDWSDEVWAEWDTLLVNNPSAYLDSRSIKAALDVEERKLAGDTFYS